MMSFQGALNDIRAYFLQHKVQGTVSVNGRRVEGRYRLNGVVYDCQFRYDQDEREMSKDDREKLKALRMNELRSRLIRHHVLSRLIRGPFLNAPITEAMQKEVNHAIDQCYWLEGGTEHGRAEENTSDRRHQRAGGRGDEERPSDRVRDDRGHQQDGA